MKLEIFLVPKYIEMFQCMALLYPISFGPMFKYSLFHKVE